MLINQRKTQQAFTESDYWQIGESWHIFTSISSFQTQSERSIRHPDAVGVKLPVPRESQRSHEPKHRDTLLSLILF